MGPGPPLTVTVNPAAASVAGTSRLAQSITIMLRTRARILLAPAVPVVAAPVIPLLPSPAIPANTPSPAIPPPTITLRSYCYQRRPGQGRCFCAGAYPREVHTPGSRLAGGSRVLAYDDRCRPHCATAARRRSRPQLGRGDAAQHRQRPGRRRLPAGRAGREPRPTAGRRGRHVCALTGGAPGRAADRGRAP